MYDMPKQHTEAHVANTCMYHTHKVTFPELGSSSPAFSVAAAFKGGVSVLSSPCECRVLPTRCKPETTTRNMQRCTGGIMNTRSPKTLHVSCLSVPFFCRNRAQKHHQTRRKSSKLLTYLLR